MPHIPFIAPSNLRKLDTNPYRVLITGFGPFASYAENPSWLAVRELHNVLLEPDALDIEPITIDNQVAFDLKNQLNSRSIHITALEIPVSYSTVLSVVPGLHARPPILPNQNLPGTIGFNSPRVLAPDPPADGFDYILHIGASKRGCLRAEKLGHKSGYYNKDANGEYAPVINPANTQIRPVRVEDEADRFERERLGDANRDSVENRGFGKGYEGLEEELRTEIDVDTLIQSLKADGFSKIESSTNAGHYLCDFVYYCSLAESYKTQMDQRPEGGNGKDTRVIFVHCPPVGEELTTSEVTDALKRIVSIICSQKL